MRHMDTPKTGLTPEEIEQLKREIAPPVTTGLTPEEIAAKQEALKRDTAADMAAIRRDYAPKAG